MRFDTLTTWFVLTMMVKLSKCCRLIADIEIAPTRCSDGAMIDLSSGSEAVVDVAGGSD